MSDNITYNNVRWRIKNRYNPEHDIDPDSAPVTNTDMDLLELVDNLKERIEELEKQLKIATQHIYWLESVQEN